MWIAAGCGSQQTAARLLGAYVHHRASSGSSGGEYEEYERLASEVTSDLGAATFEDELRLGAQLSINQALQLAEDIMSAAA
jgi:hypothetical protein